MVATLPPIVTGAISGNIQLLLVPLLLSRGAWLAPLLKAYAAVPLVLLGRWRPLLVFGALLVATVPILPWGPYMARFAEINGVLADQSKTGISGPLLLAAVPIGLVCLWIVGRETAAWLVVPAFWPSQQSYYATFVMPTRSRLVAAVVAPGFASSGFAALVVAALGRLVLTEQERQRSLANPHPDRSATPVAPAEIPVPGTSGASSDR